MMRPASDADVRLLLRSTRRSLLLARITSFNDLISAAKMPSFLLLLFLVSGVMGSVFSGGGSPNDNEDSSGEAPILDRPVIAYPVSNIRFDSVLDQRLGYFGNAVLTISWEHPEDSRCLNDYIIEAQSIYGCTYQNYTSESINKSTTSHIVIAAAPGDFPLYNCDYSVNVFSRFEQRESSSTQLFLRRDDKIQGLKLYCMQSQWSEVSYKFSYKLEWTLPFYMTLDENIERFLIDLRTYPFGKVERTNFAVNKTTYVYEWNDLPPCNEDYHFIAFAYWSKHLRFVRPYMEAECFVDATSPSPSKICNISVISYSWDSHLSLLHVDLSWDPPAVVNGVLSGYNVSIGTRLLKDQDDNFPLLGYIWDSTNSTASIDLDFTGLGQSDLVLQIRAWNQYVPGNWSGGLILPITGSVAIPQSTATITTRVAVTPTSSTPIKNVALPAYVFGIIGGGVVAAAAAAVMTVVALLIMCKLYQKKRQPQKGFTIDPLHSDQDAPQQKLTEQTLL